MIIYLSLLVAILGLLTYALSNNPKAMEAGRLAWMVGLLAFLLRIAELPVVRTG